MLFTRENIHVIVGAIISVLLQIIVAPHVAIGKAVPDFVAVFVFLCAVVRCQTFGPVLPFAMGLIFDLVSGGPVGGMAFALTLFSYLASRVFSAMDNDTLFMPIAVMAVGLLLSEVAYGAILLALGYQAGLLAVFGFIVVPCTIYNGVLAALLLPLAARFFVSDAPTDPNVTQLR